MIKIKGAKKLTLPSQIYQRKSTLQIYLRGAKKINAAIANLPGECMAIKIYQRKSTLQIYLGGAKILTLPSQIYLVNPSKNRPLNLSTLPNLI